jgi:hypothetical protein
VPWRWRRHCGTIPLCANGSHGRATGRAETIVDLAHEPSLLDGTRKSWLSFTSLGSSSDRARMESGLSAGRSENHGYGVAVSCGERARSTSAKERAIAFPLSTPVLKETATPSRLRYRPLRPSLKTGRKLFKGKDVILAFDGDQAGEDSTRRITPLLTPVVRV